MAFRITSRYEDLIDEPIENIDVILSVIPTVALLFNIAAINARIDSKISEEENLTFFFRRIQHKYYPVKKKIDKFYSKNHGPISIFSKLHLCRLAMVALKSPNLEIRDTTPDEDWQIFRAYMALINEYNDSQEVVFQQDFNSELDTFNNLTWPTIAEQYQFLNDRNTIFDVIRTIALVDELIENDYESELKKYSTEIGMPVLDMISNIFGMSNHQQMLNYDGWKTPSYFIHLNNSNTEVFKSLTLDIESISKEKNYDDNFLALKKYPLLSYKDDILVIINRSYLKNKIYNGFLFDFYVKSGIKKKVKGFDDFKSFIGKEVAEKRLLIPLIKTIFPKDHNIKIFSEKDSHPDCYLRIHNRIFLIEFKDYMMSSRVINSLDVDTFKEEVDKKFIENKKGKPKGVTQLANQINFISENQYEFDEIYTNGFDKSKLEIYPIIVYTDYQYSIPGINNYLTKKFKSLLNQDLGFKAVYPSTMININFLFNYANYISANRLDNLIKSYYKKKKTREVKLAKDETPDNWVLANLSFDDIGVKIDKNKKVKTNILDKFRKNIDLKNVIK